MAAYATTTDVQTLMLRTMEPNELDVCSALLDQAAVIIDSVASTASNDVKKVVSCRMVIRALGDGSTGNIPIGATQGSMGAGGYTQSWTIGSGSAGELYVSKTERRILGVGNRIGVSNPYAEGSQ